MSADGRTLLVLAGLAAALAGCAPRPPGDLSSNDQILTGHAVADVFKQCSRDTPARGIVSWTPTGRDIAAFRDALRAALERESIATELVVRGAPRGWTGQYAGYFRGGRRLIYGNFFQVSDGVEAHWFTEFRRSGEAMVACDGGAAYFGAEYDPQTKAITHLAFNGAP